MRSELDSLLHRRDWIYRQSPVLLVVAALLCVVAITGLLQTSKLTS